MLYGKDVDNGIIDLNKTIKQLGIDDVARLLPEEEKATVQEIISARSGVYQKRKVRKACYLCILFKIS